MSIGSRLQDAFLVELVQPYVLAEEEIRITILNRQALWDHREARRQILAGISLWLTLQAVWRNAFEAWQLDRLWRREEYERWGSDSDCSSAYEV